MNAVPGPITFLLPSLGGGGAEMHCLRLVNEPVWTDGEVALVLARSGGKYEGLVRAGVSVHHLLPDWVRSSAMSMVLSVLPLARWIEHHRPRIIVSFLNHTTVVLDLALKWCRHQPQVVVGLQNNFSVECTSWRGPFGHLFARQVKYAHARADRLVALSHGVAEDYRLRCPENGDRLHMIYNAGYDQRVIELGRQTVDLPRRPRQFRLVACGRLTEQKDYPLLLQTLAWLRPWVDCELLILGDGHLRKQLEGLAAELGIQREVRFLGFQKNPYRYIASGDVFVLSSAWEGFGNVLVEAMAVGCPVVAMDCPFGPAEIIENERTGWLVKDRSPAALGKAILEVLQHPERSRERVQVARARAAQFSAATTAHHYAQLFASIRTSTRDQGVESRP